MKKLFWLLTVTVFTLVVSLSLALTNVKAENEETIAMSLTGYGQADGNTNSLEFVMGNTIDGGTDEFMGWIFNITSLCNDLTKIYITSGQNTYTCTGVRYNIPAIRNSYEFVFGGANGWQANNPSEGDYLTIAQGFTITTATQGVIEAKADINYVFNGQTWISGKTIQSLSETTVKDVNCANIGYGDMIVIGMQKDCSGYWGAINTDKIEYIDKDGNFITVNAETCGNSVAINRNGRKAEVGDEIVIKAGFVWCEEEIKADVTYLYQTANEPWVLTKNEIKVVDINWTSSYAGFAGPCVSVNFGVNTTLGDWASYSDLSKVEFVKADGTKVLEKADVQGAYFNINRDSNSYQAQVGDKVTFKKGFVWNNLEIKHDITYVYQTADQAWTVYVEEEKGELTVVDINWTASYAGFAGPCVSVNFGVNTTLGDWASYSDLSKVEFVKADGTNALEKADVQGAYFNINRDSNSYQAQVGDKVTFKKGFVWNNLEIKKDITYIYETANQPWVVYYEDMTVLDINWSSAWSATLARFSSNTQIGGFDSNMYDKSELIVYKNSQGVVETTRNAVHEDYIFLFDRPAKLGDTITFKKGILLNEKQLKADVTYIYVTADQPWVLYDSTYAPTSVEITNEETDNIVRINATKQLTYTVNEGAVCTPTFTSSNESVATVNSSGLVTGISEGTATITITAGTLTDTFEVEVKPELVIKGLKFDQSYTIWIHKGDNFFIPENFTAKIIYDDAGEDAFGLPFALTSDNTTYASVDTSVEGDQTIELTVTYNEVEYKLYASCKVYEYDEMVVTEVAIVEWFVFNIFIQFPNSTLNDGNLTNSALYPDAYLFEYKKADGTPVSCGAYNLSGGNIVIMPSFNDGQMGLDTFNKAPYYEVGDTITLKKGFAGYLWTGELAPTASDNKAIKENTGMVIKECVLKEDTTFKFDGSIWGLFVEYTDVTTAKDTIEVGVSKTQSCGATRVPQNATEGDFSYVSSDETIATVSQKGVITGVKVGTCTITITLKNGKAGEKTKTITVNVVDAITGFEVKADEDVKVEFGADGLDITKLKGYLVYASGRKEEIALTDAKITGLDTEEEGEQTVTIKVSVEGKNYTTTLKVTVNPEAKVEPKDVVPTKGCNSSIATLGLSICFIALAGFVVKKKKEN